MNVKQKKQQCFARKNVISGKRALFLLKSLLKKFEFVLIPSFTILLNFFMIVKGFMTVEAFFDCGKTFLIAAKIIGVAVVKQWRYAVFDPAIIKLTRLIYQYSQDYSLMVKTSDYQRMELLRMQVENQREAGFMAVEPLLWGGPRHINRTFFGER